MENPEEEVERNIPDIDYITNTVLEMLEYMATPEMRELKQHDENEYTNNIRHKYHKFEDEFYAVYNLVLSGGDINILMSMLKTLNNVKNNKLNLDQADKLVNDNLNQKYINPLL